MTGQIALVGGDEFRPGCEEMDHAILSATGVERPSLQVVPTAAADQNPQKAASKGVAYFSGLGADAAALMVLNKADASDQTLLSPVDSADVVYLTGGNPAHLLDTLADSLLLQKINQALERGAMLAGSSAGAMVMGSWMRFRNWTKALGLVPGVATLPHHERSDLDAVAKELLNSAPPDATILGVDGKTGCLGGPNEWTVLGTGRVTVYYNGRWERFEAGDVFTLDSDKEKS